MHMSSNAFKASATTRFAQARVAWSSILAVAVIVILTLTAPLARADHPHPGGVAFISLGAYPEKPVGRFGRRKVLVTQNGSQWIAVVGLAPELLPGE